MPSFYFLWNPLKTRPGLGQDLSKVARLLAAGKRCRIWNWSTGNRTQTDLPSGSQFFLVRTGKEGRGVIGYGTIPTGQLYPDRHYIDPRRKAIYVHIQFERLIDPEEPQNHKKLVSLGFLKAAGFGFRAWNPQANATELPDEAADRIKARFDARQGLAPTVEELQTMDPHLASEDLAAPEGRILVKNHLVRERNPALVSQLR